MQNATIKAFVLLALMPGLTLACASPAGPNPGSDKTRSGADTQTRANHHTLTAR